MAAKFLAEAIARTQNGTDAKRLEITFLDAEGRLQTVSFTPAAARCLSRAIQDFAVASRADGPIPTKMPKEFAVGIGRYEQLVLIRFEDDAPYGLKMSQAAQLGHALVEHAEMAASHPLPLRQ